MVMDSLRYWVEEMHVDGFRFDLATTLARTAGSVDTWAAFFATMHQDPIIQRVKLIAEPWDVGTNGYQAGNFPFHWSEWNDRFRETVRASWSGGGDCGELARRITASPDLFQRSGRTPSASINYVCSHDGLTLRDLVVTQIPDGPDEETTSAARQRRHRNLLATTLLSMGAPMVTAGDEWGRSQGGNDNAYDQDNEISWLDWDRADHPMAVWTAGVIRLRARLPWLERDVWPGEALQVRWLRPDGAECGPDDWAAGRGFLALHAIGTGGEALWLLNTVAGDVEFFLPQPAAGGWRVALDTASDGDDAGVPAGRFAVGGKRMLVLLSAGHRPVGDPE
jgi:isoamylase